MKNSNFSTKYNNVIDYIGNHIEVYQKSNWLIGNDFDLYKDGTVNVLKKMNDLLSQTFTLVDQIITECNYKYQTNSVIINKMKLLVSKILQS